MRIKIKHDQQAAAAYIRLSKNKHSKTNQLDENVLVDVDSDGGVIGIEVNNVTEVVNDTEGSD